MRLTQLTKLIAALIGFVHIAALKARFAVFPPRARAGAPRRLLVLGYAAIGDLIFLLPALRLLRESFPGARITFVADLYAGTADILPSSKLVDDIWLYEHEELASGRVRRALARRFAAADFDAVVVSQATPMRPFAAAILPIPTRIGHWRPLEAPHAGWPAARYALWRLKRALISDEFERRLALNCPILVREDGEHTVARNLRLLEPLGLSPPSAIDCRPSLPMPAAAAEFAARELPAALGLKTVGLHIGKASSAYAKVWPAARWGETCRALARRYPLRLVLFGGPDEKDLIAPFADAFQGPIVDLVGRCGILESFAAIGRCDLFLGNDTGLAKAAMALGTPTLTVWGPSDRFGHGIVWEPGKHTEVFRPMPCAPCVRMGLRAEGAGVINFSNCGHRACLAALAPETVADAAARRYGVLLAAAPPSKKLK